MRIATFTTITILLMSAGAYADVAPNPLVTGGASVSSRDADTPVNMAWEEVDITPSADKNAVTAVFLLKNTSDKPTSLEVGFPDYNQVKLKDFTVAVDEVKTSAEVKKEDLHTGLNGKKTLHLEWTVWPMAFEGGQQKKVTVSYDVPPTTGSRWKRVEPSHGASNTVIDDGINVERCTQLPADVKQKLVTYTSGYVLHTGAGWHGNIGKATIRIHRDALPADENFVITNTPKSDAKWSYDDKTKIQTLILNDFKPDDSSDIAYEFRLASPKEQLALLTDAMEKKQLDTAAALGVIEELSKAGKDPADHERTDKLAHLKELALPPAGPAIDPASVTPRMEDQIKSIANDLMARYKTAGDTDKAQQFAASYLKVIDSLVTSYTGRYTAKWTAQRTSMWDGEKQKVNAYLASMSTQAATK